METNCKKKKKTGLMMREGSGVGVGIMTALIRTVGANTLAAA